MTPTIGKHYYVAHDGLIPAKCIAQTQYGTWVFTSWSGYDLQFEACENLVRAEYIPWYKRLFKSS